MCVVFRRNLKGQAACQLPYSTVVFCNSLDGRRPANLQTALVVCMLAPASRQTISCPQILPPNRTFAKAAMCVLNALQDVIVGGAVTAAVGAAFYTGLKKEPEACDLCAGNGGIRCFACSGDGTREVIDKSILSEGRPKRDVVGRSGNPRNCRVCGGTGLVLCSKCKGSGYMTKF
jgi:hypothetical protein